MFGQSVESIKKTGALAGALFVMALFACYTVPKGTDGDWAAALPESQNEYLKVNVDQNRTLVKSLIETVMADPAMYLKVLPNIAAVYVSGDSSGQHMVVLGKFPSWILYGELSKNASYERIKGKPDYFRSKVSTQEICSPEDGLILISSGKLDIMLARYRSGAKLETLMGEDLSAWKAYAAAAVGTSGFGLVDNNEGSFASIALNVKKQKKRYLLTVKIICKDDSGLKPARAVLKLMAGSAAAKYALGDGAPLTETVKIETNELTVSLVDLPFPEKVFPVWAGDLLGTRMGK